MLCKEFYGDAICAEEHVTTHAHNESYKVSNAPDAQLSMKHLVQVH